MKHGKFTAGPDIGVRGGGGGQAGFYLGFIGLKLMAILLYQPPKFWDYKDDPPHPAEVVSL